MNKNCLPKLLFVGLLVILTACQATGKPRNAEVFSPGDTIDGLSLATGAADAPPLWAFCSPAQHSGNSTISDCSVPMIHKLAIGQVFMVADDRLNELDWSELTWELSINHQPVDLEAFGTFDYVMPSMSKSPSPLKEVFKTFTAWDVVLTNLSPGQHTIRGLAQTETDSYTWIVNLTIGTDSFGPGIPWTGIQKVS
jgi:hypothetical protein